MKYVCDVCGYVYDEEVEGTPFSELPEDYACPLCAVGKDQFSAEEQSFIIKNPIEKGGHKVPPFFTNKKASTNMYLP